MLSEAKGTDAAASFLADRSGDEPMADEEAEDNEGGNPQAKKRKLEFSTADVSDEENPAKHVSEEAPTEKGNASTTAEETELASGEGMDNLQQIVEKPLGTTTSGTASAEQSLATPTAERSLDETHAATKRVAAFATIESQTSDATVDAVFAHQGADTPSLHTTHAGAATADTEVARLAAVEAPPPPPAVQPIQNEIQQMAAEEIQAVIAKTIEALLPKRDNAGAAAAPALSRFGSNASIVLAITA